MTDDAAKVLKIYRFWFFFTISRDARSFLRVIAKMLRDHVRRTVILVVDTSAIFLFPHVHYANPIHLRDSELVQEGGGDRPKSRSKRRSLDNDISRVASHLLMCFTSSPPCRFKAKDQGYLENYSIT